MRYQPTQFGRRVALGETQPVVMTCPHCSYLWDGRCVICADGDPHPGCEDCVGGKLPRAPWYYNDLLLSIGTAVVVTVAVSLLVPRVERWLK